MSDDAKVTGFRFEDGGFLILLTVVTLGFGLLIEPFIGAVLWSLVAGIMFSPINRRFERRMPGRPNSAAGLTLLIIIALIIIPAIFLTVALIQEGVVIYSRVQSGEIDFARYFDEVIAALPGWVSTPLERFGITDFAAAREMLQNGFARSFQSLAGQALTVGQGAFSFFVALGVMLYLTYFLLRDGPDMVRRVGGAVPLRSVHKGALAEKFVTVVRATIKGSVVVAIVQGLIGGVAFAALGIPGALLWGVAMGFFSLLPAIGTGLVWVPVAIYLLATGQYVSGGILVFIGVFIIGMVDNVLRPLLVGRDTRMPDWLVLISTLGGIEVFGFNGFVVGPVIAALFLAVWKLQAESRRSEAPILPAHEAKPLPEPVITGDRVQSAPDGA